MIVVHLNQIIFGYGKENLFHELSFEIKNNRCIGLVGANGCGKSTLLHLITGELVPDEGVVNREKNLRIGYLQQEPQFTESDTLWDSVYFANKELMEIENQLSGLELQLGDPEIYSDEKKLARTLDIQQKYLEDYEKWDGPRYEGLVRSNLLELGFDEIDFHKPVSVLSGGQKKLAGLARLLVYKPDILLLDEPDNHLDLQGKAYLEQFIRNFSGGVVIVSHDRYLLDLIVDEVAELENGKITCFSGNYSEYVFEKELLQQQMLHQFQAQQKEIHRLELAAKRLLTWGKVFDNEKFSRRGKNIMKRLDNIDRLDRPEIDKAAMGLDLSSQRGSEKVLEISKLGKTFAVDRSEEVDVILENIDLLIMRGERVGLVGPNGAGKSLLFRMILGSEEPTSGDIQIGPSVQIGYYAQQHEILDMSKTLIDTIRFGGNLSTERSVAFLKRFLFTYEQAQGPVSNLSGGERSRLQMALLMLSKANFLLLDEPTNNLDIRSIEVLEDALEKYEGTVFTISHDRYFLDRIATRIVELDGQISSFIGNYSDYQNEKMKE